MLRFLARSRAAALFIITVLTFLVIGVLAPGYLAVETVRTVAINGLVLMTVTVGVMGVILTRNIDVSLGSTLALSAAVLGLLLRNGFDIKVAIPAAIMTGGVCGLVNGLLVSFVRVPSIVATLGTLGLFRGVMLMLTGGVWLEDLPASLKHLARPIFIGLPPVAFLVFAVVLGAHYFLTSTKVGRYVYAVGDNAVAALHIGLPSRQITMATFIVSGALAGLGGVLYSAQIGFVPTNAGNGIELRAIAACVLGGVSLLGGSGTIVGIVIAVFFMISIDTALIFLKMPGYWNDLIAGVMLLGILVIDGRVRAMVDKAARAQRYRTRNRPGDPTQEQVSNPGVADATMTVAHR